MAHSRMAVHIGNTDCCYRQHSCALTLRSCAAKAACPHIFAVCREKLTPLSGYDVVKKFARKNDFWAPFRVRATGSTSWLFGHRTFCLAVTDQLPLLFLVHLLGGWPGAADHSWPGEVSISGALPPLPPHRMRSSAH